MKKTLALVLALAMVFSSITVAFAEDTLGEDAQICADLGMLKGETGTVDAAYVATAPTRLQAAVMFLRLKGLEAEALAFTGEDNFADGEIAWAEGANLIAYLKANPQLGWIGDGTNFNPTGVMTAQAYYKVLLEALGYKQTTAEVAGDFAWEEVFTFAASVGLSKVAAVESFTVNDLAVATVEALKVNVKDTEKTLAATLVEAGVVGEAAAVAAGLVEAAPTAPAVAIDEAVAVGNAAVDVTFEDDVDASAADAANFAIEGLEILDAAVVDEDTIRLTTEAMTSGKIYKLTVGEKTVQFTGIAKVSGGPSIDEVVGEDVEEIVITFDKNIDLATGMDVANYSVSGGVEVISAEVDGKDVILTTEGLKNKTKYTVKATNIKSTDGVTKKTTSDTFTSKYDLAAPKIDGDVDVQTNQRIVVTFNEKVTEGSASDLANYAIRVDETDGAELEILEVKYITTGDFKQKRVELITEPMEKREDYKLSVSNIADKRKVANVMTRAATKTFKGIAEDTKAPVFADATVLSPTKILVKFTDDSRIDEDSALDLNNYTLESLDVEAADKIESKNGLFRALLTVEEMTTGKTYELKAVDILDEFGNAMDEKKKSARAMENDIASVKVTRAIAKNENTVYVIFNGEVDEESAENIANYSIDEGIGAPTKAEYGEVTGVGTDVVTLTVNDLENGFEYAGYYEYAKYDLVVDGVLDLAGNELYYKKKVETDVYTWDNDVPEVEDVEIVYNNRVALSFDEKVAYKNDARLVLAVDVAEDGTYDPNENVELVAKDYADDFTTVEFSGALATGKTYTVVNVVYDPLDNGVFEDGGIADLIGNSVLNADIEDNYYSFDYINDAPEGPEVDSFEQVNGISFEVTMTRWVELFDGDGVGGTNVVDNGDGTFNVKATEGDIFKASVEDDVVTLTLAGGIKEKDYTFDISKFIRDKHSVAAVNDDTTNAKTVFEGDYEDKDAPYIDEVVAKNRKTIKITFNEDIRPSSVSEGDFTLKNYDTDKTVSFTVTKKEDDVVELTVSKALEARYEYELVIQKKAVKDVAGNDSDDSTETFYFDGTNLTE